MGVLQNGGIVGGSWHITNRFDKLIDDGRCRRQRWGVLLNDGIGVPLVVHGMVRPGN